MNGALSSLNWTITPILMPENTFTPLAPNVINLNTIISWHRSPNNTMASTNTRFELSDLTPSTTHYKDNNKGVHYQFSTT
jgi:hypothetical protein